MKKVIIVARTVQDAINAILKNTPDVQYSIHVNPEVEDVKFIDEKDCQP
jgi:hypothetical protein